MKIGISACLLGDNVRYDGKNQKSEELLELLKGHELIKICPEVFAGMPIPRIPMEIINNSVVNKAGVDLTNDLKIGITKSLAIIKDCDFFILKNKSPSCGVSLIYDGTFTGKLIQGNGLFTQALLRQNKKVFNNEDLDEIKAYLNL